MVPYGEIRTIGSCLADGTDMSDSTDAGLTIVYKYASRYNCLMLSDFFFYYTFELVWSNVTIVDFL